MTAPAANRSHGEAVSYRKVAVADGTLPIAVVGPDNAAAMPLILLHGWTLDHRMWAPQIADLAPVLGQLPRPAPLRRGAG